MNNSSQDYGGRRIIILCGVVLLGVGIFAYQVNRNLALKKRIRTAITEIQSIKKSSAELLAKQESSAGKVELLLQHEKRIPFAENGYVWVSRILSGSVPSLALKISPPDFASQKVPFSADYSCGTFQVNGSGGFNELLRILQKIESDLPFARVQDLHFTLREDSLDRVDFAFSLVAVMKLSQE